MTLINDNFNELKSYAVNIIEYIKQLGTSTESILISQRNTGFFGFIIYLTNMFVPFNILKKRTYISMSFSKITSKHFSVRCVAEEDLIIILAQSNSKLTTKDYLLDMKLKRIKVIALLTICRFYTYHQRKKEAMASQKWMI